MSWPQFVPHSELIYQQGPKYSSDVMSQGGTMFFPPQYQTPNFECNQRNQDMVEKWKEQRQNDTDFINQFIYKLEGKQTEAVRKPLKIYEVKNLLLDIVELRNNLEKKAKALSINDENFSSQWDIIQEDMNLINEKILLLNDISQPLKIEISKKIKARSSRKRRSIKNKTLSEKLKVQINEKHKVIDKILEDKKQEVLSVKREAALKRQADSVLHEVRRKKYEGTKMLNLLSALSKLRGLRIEEEEKKGGYCSKQLTNVFNEVIDRFKELWKKQIEAYKLEEKGLKMMLEENTLPPVKDSKFEINLLHWEKALFGCVSTDEEIKALQPIDDELEAFIQTRQEWDRFIVVEPTAVASSIPPGWVLPPETDNDDWLKYIKSS
ncbi:hypothetical protein RUM43_001421 [Polyplax serrata]|uniref:Programmed cell death protein 7 n=1 Tax=Polyplax serrata TaxID=468196 RepID=A0AAN8XQN3_POLSC